MDPRTAKMLAEHEAGRRVGTSAAEWRRPPHQNRSTRGSERIECSPFAAAIATIVILFFVYYQLVALPAQQRERVEREVRAVARLKTMNAARQVSLDTCLSTVKTEADTRWNNQCRVRRRGATCSLPDRVADRLEREESQARNGCLTQFSVATQ